MNHLDVAMKFASASATCKNGKCPYTADCRGTTDTCKMKEVAMMIRALDAEIETLRAKCEKLENELAESRKYASSLEVINERYYRLTVSFQNGYRPKAKIKRKRINKPSKKKLDNPVLMDGDERYAKEEPKKKKPDLPVVII